jgi:hypothetical protein
MFWLFTTVVLSWAHIHHFPLKKAVATKQNKVLAVVNALLVAVLVVLSVLVSVASEGADRKRYIWMANITMGVLSLVLAFLLAFYSSKISALRSAAHKLKSKLGGGHGKSTHKNHDTLQSLLLGVLFCGQAGCWAVSDPKGDHLAAVVVVSHSLSSAALVLLFSIYQRSAVSLRGRSSTHGRRSTAPKLAAGDKTRPSVPAGGSTSPSVKSLRSVRSTLQMNRRKGHAGRSTLQMTRRKGPPATQQIGT